MRKLLLLSFFLLTSLTCLAQEDKPKPHRWHNLTLEVSTPEDAVKELGTPKKDKPESLLILKPKWVTKVAQKGKWRVLHYENIGEFNDVKLGFNSENKLVIIHLEPKKLTAQSVATAYEDVNLRHGDTVLTPADLSRKLENEYPNNFGAWYVLLGGTDKVFVFAGIANSYGGVGKLFGTGVLAGNRNRSLPGDVKQLQLVSRTLENKDGVDILK